MNPTERLLAGVVARLLEPGEREAVLGDLEEAGEAGWRAGPPILGLALRRQAVPWKGWRPWCAALGLALPESFLLMGASLSVYEAGGRIAGPGGGTPAGSAAAVLLAVHLLLLVGWSWSGGYLVGSLSRRTLWASLAAVAVPCLFCLARFQVPAVSPAALLLFLGPAAWGVRRGLKPAPLGPGAAAAIALGVTFLTIAAAGGDGRAAGTCRGWVFDLALCLPPWLLLARAAAGSRPLRVGAA
jgi:hypothetical protein